MDIERYGYVECWSIARRYHDDIFRPRSYSVLMSQLSSLSDMWLQTRLVVESKLSKKACLLFSDLHDTGN